MVILSALFSFLILAPLSITVVYRTNVLGMKNLSSYYSVGHSLYNSLPLFFLGLATVQVFVSCYYFGPHYCPSFFSFKPWAHKWADLSSLLLADSIFGDLFIDVESRYVMGDLIFYDKTKILHHEKILHTFDANHMYVLTARNQSTGSFILDLTKPKSLIVYKLVKNYDFSIEPFKFTCNYQVSTHIPNGFRELPDFKFYPIDRATGAFQIFDKSFVLRRLTHCSGLLCYKSIVYKIFEPGVGLNVQDSHFWDSHSHTTLYKNDGLTLAIPYKIRSDPFSAQKFLAPSFISDDAYKGSFSRVYKKF